MKAMSIIGIVWFSISLIGLFALVDVDIEAAVGWGMLGLLYALPYSIVGLVKSKNLNKPSKYEELERLLQLKEKGVISEMEFNHKKIDLMNK
jgi:hypothetical protein